MERRYDAYDYGTISNAIEDNNVTYESLLCLWQNVQLAINIAKPLFATYIQDKAYEADVYDDTTEFGQQYAEIKELDWYLEIFSRYFN